MVSETIENNLNRHEIKILKVAFQLGVLITGDIYCYDINIQATMQTNFSATFNNFHNTMSTAAYANRPHRIVHVMLPDWIYIWKQLWQVNNHIWRSWISLPLVYVIDYSEHN